MPQHATSQRSLGLLARPAAFFARSTAQLELPVWTLSEGQKSLLIAHATGFHGRAYLPLALQLAAQAPDRYQVYAADLRGHGDAPSPADLDYHWDGFADDVLVTVDAIQARRSNSGAILGFGHSMGGASLLRAEQRRPGTFSALVLYEPIVAPPIGFRGESPIAAAARKRRTTFPSFEAAIDNFSTKAPLNTLRHDALEAYVRHGFSKEGDGSVRLKMSGNEEALVFGMSLEHDTWQRLDEVKCPVLVAFGGAEQAFAASFAPRVAERLPAGKAVALFGLNHFGPLQDPTAVAETTNNFFEQVL